jgi:tetratricopeptide (TPR) repeat protein
VIDDEKLQELLTQASSLYNNGNYQGAITSWQEALSVDPSNQKAKEGIRMATLLLGEWEPAAPEGGGAAETAEEADIGGAPVSSLPPEEVEARLDLGRARVKQLLAERKYREAVDGAKSLLPLAPESDDLHRLIEEAQHGFESTPFVDEHLTLARELLAQERYAEAESECKKIFVIDPRHPAGSALMREIRARVQESLQRAASQMGGMTVKLSLPDLKNLRPEGTPREAARPAAPEPPEPEAAAAPEAGRWPPYAPPSKEEIAAGMEPPSPAASEFAESEVAGAAGPPGVPAPPAGAHPPGVAHAPRIGHPPASTAPTSGTGDLAHSQEEVRARDLLDQAFAAEGVAEPSPEPAEPSQTAAPEPVEPAPPAAGGGLPISHVEETESPFELSHGVAGPKGPETVEAKTITPPTVRKVTAAKEGGRDTAPPAPPAPAPSLEFKGTDDPSSWEAELAQLNLKEGERGLLGRKPMPPASGAPAEVPDVDLMSLLDADIGGPAPKPAPAADPPPLPQKTGAKPEKPAVQPGVKPVAKPEKAAAAGPAATPRPPRPEPKPAAGELQESAESLESVAERPARPKSRPRPVPARSSSPFLFVLLGLVLVAGGGAAWWLYFQPKFVNAASAGSPAQTSGPPQGAPAPPNAGGGPIPTPIGGPARPAQDGGAEAAAMTGPPPAPSIEPQGGEPAAAAPAARTPPVDTGPIKPQEAPRLSPEEMRRRVAVFTADGRRLMAQGKWREARAKFIAVLALDPTNFDVKEMHDEVQAKIDDEQRLIDDMDSAKQLVADKDYENALRKLYRLPRDRGLGNIDLYIRNAWFNWAVVQLKAGNAKDALVKLSEVLTLDPDDAEALRLQEVAERYLNKAKDRVYYAFTDTLRLRAFDQK